LEEMLLGMEYMVAVGMMVLDELVDINTQSMKNKEVLQGRDGPGSGGDRGGLGGHDQPLSEGKGGGREGEHLGVVACQH